jgi:hypothetical protein
VLGRKAGKNIKPKKNIKFFKDIKQFVEQIDKYSTI